MASDPPSIVSDPSAIASDPSAASEHSSVEAPHVIPVHRREVFAITIWTLLADIFIFRTWGYAGPALFFTAVPLLFALGCQRLHINLAWKIATMLLVIVALRLVWSGSALPIFAAVSLVIAVAMASAGAMPLVLEGFLIAGRMIVDGARRVAMFRWSSVARSASSTSTASDSESKSAFGTLMVTYGLPVLAAVVFGSIFILANPDLLDAVSIRLSRITRSMMNWLQGVSIWEVPFCVLALLIGAGLMHPAFPLPRVGREHDGIDSPTESARSPLYSAYRNTLITLIVLFAVYLVFEFATLWRREFPPGFYYAGYAHQGAAWLTFALALATATLSLTFSGAMLRDDRLSVLRKYAWIWSVQNLLLAAAVYNRLIIYVGYNGMTRMRTVGFFGITLVVVGFGLVVYKIAKNHGFWWVIRSQLVALMLTVIAYSVFPVDYVAHRHNVATVNAGYLHPSVMIVVKSKDDEGYLPLFALTDHDDPIIRDGVLAILAQREAELDAMSAAHWTEFQAANWLLYRRLKENHSDWIRFQQTAARASAIERFRNYAMQWY